MKRLHLAGLVGALTTASGLLASPLVAGLLPPHWAAAMIAVGGAIQAVTRAVHKGDVVEVPKEGGQG